MFQAPVYNNRDCAGLWKKRMDIDISTRHGGFYAGDVIDGTVNVNVKDAKGSPATELVLRMFGVVKTISMIYTGHGTTRRAEERKFLSYEIPLASFPGMAPCGNHGFPFSVVLPPDLAAPSLKENSSNGGSCEVEYGFKVRLHRPGMVHFDAKATATITVLGRPPEDCAAVPVVVGPVTETVKKLGLFHQGLMSVGFQADRSAVAVNAPIMITVVGRNHSTASVTSLIIKIDQVSQWSAHGIKEKRTRTIASVEVPGSDLVGLQPTEIGGKRGKGDASVADIAREDLEEQLAEGTGTRHQILIPGDSLLTLQAETIGISHALIVRLKTSRLNSSIELSMPVFIHAEATSLASEVTPEEVSFVPLPLSDEAAPFACRLTP